MPNWQTFDRHATPSPGMPFVTIQREGVLITLNKAAYQLLKMPEAVDLLYDPDERLIGIKPMDGTNPRAYMVRPMAKSQSTQTIAGRAFTLHWGIDTRVALRYSCRLDGDTLIVDLKQEGVDVTGVRSRIKNAAGLRTRFKGQQSR